jgi:Flp pilus assembly pilin Flp
MYAAPYKWLFQEAGQEIMEYSLLLAFVALVSAALFLSSATNMSLIWSSANSALRHTP